MENNKQIELVELEYTSEVDFITTKHFFSKEHYEVACSLADMNNNLGKIFVHPNKQDLMVCFDFSNQITDRVQREIHRHEFMYRVIIQCPENSMILHHNLK